MSIELGKSKIERQKKLPLEIYVYVSKETNQFILKGKFQSTESVNSDSQNDIKKLAEDFSKRYWEYNAKISKDYYLELKFNPPKEESCGRELTIEEQTIFMDAFRKANEQATKKKYS